MILLHIIIGAFIGIAVVKHKLKRLGLQREYVVQFRQKGTEDEWRNVFYSLGTHEVSYGWIKTLQREYPQYDFRIATRYIGKWVA